MAAVHGLSGAVHKRALELQAEASKGLRMFDIEEMGPNMQMDHLAGASKVSQRGLKGLDLRHRWSFATARSRM